MKKKKTKRIYIMAEYIMFSMTIKFKKNVTIYLQFLYHYY